MQTNVADIRIINLPQHQRTTYVRKPYHFGQNREVLKIEEEKFFYFLSFSGI